MNRLAFYIFLALGIIGSLLLFHQSRLFPHAMSEITGPFIRAFIGLSTAYLMIKIASLKLGGWFMYRMGYQDTALLEFGTPAGWELFKSQALFGVKFCFFTNFIPSILARILFPSTIEELGASAFGFETKGSCLGFLLDMITTVNIIVFQYWFFTPFSFWIMDRFTKEFWKKNITLTLIFSIPSLLFIAYASGWNIFNAHVIGFMIGFMITTTLYGLLNTWLFWRHGFMAVLGPGLTYFVLNYFFELLPRYIY